MERCTSVPVRSVPLHKQDLKFIPSNLQWSSTPHSGAQNPACQAPLKAAGEPAVGESGQLNRSPAMRRVSQKIMALGLGIKSILASSVSSVVAQRVPNFKGITLLNKIICSLCGFGWKKYCQKNGDRSSFPIEPQYIYIYLCVYQLYIYIYIMHNCLSLSLWLWLLLLLVLLLLKIS